MKFISSLKQVEHEDEGYVGVTLPNDVNLFYKLLDGEYLLSPYCDDEGFYYDKAGLDDLLTVLLELREELDK